MRIFITGANSFVGSKLQEACRRTGMDYSGIDVCGPFSSNVRQLDLRSSSIIDHIPPGSVIVHLAAVSRDSDCDADPRGAASVNIRGTANLANAAIHVGAQRMVFASSEWVYGRVPRAEPLTEEMGPAWSELNSLYAFSKATGEEVLLGLAKTLPVSILRFGIIYGPRTSNWSAFEYVVNAAMSGTVTVGSAATSRCFVHVEDVCAGILAAACEQSTDSHVWNLAGPALVSLGEIAQIAENVLGHAVTVLQTAPTDPSIRNPVSDLMQTETEWKAKWDTVAGVTELLETLDEHNRATERTSSR